MNLERERELFEVEYKKQKHTFNDSFCKFENGCYMNEKVSIAWGVWQASANREGYKLAPVEPNDHMKCVVRDFGPDIEDYEKMSKPKWESLCSDIYKAMIGACDDH